jgi:hypothetical protein
VWWNGSAVPPHGISALKTYYQDERERSGGLDSRPPNATIILVVRLRAIRRGALEQELVVDHREKLIVVELLIVS